MTTSLPSDQGRSMYRSVSKVGSIGRAGLVEACVFQAMRPATERSDVAPPPECTRDTGCQRERSGFAFGDPLASSPTLSTALSPLRLTDSKASEGERSP